MGLVALLLLTIEKVVFDRRCLRLSPLRFKPVAPKCAFFAYFAQVRTYVWNEKVASNETLLYFPRGW